jgi:hypothetical protein
MLCGRPLVEDSGCMPIQSLAHNVAQLDAILRHVVYEMPHDADVLFSVLLKCLNRQFQTFHFSCQSFDVVFERNVVLFHFQAALLGFHKGCRCFGVSRRIPLPVVIVFDTDLDI